MSLVGESYLVGLIGSGISASLSPLLHEKEADRQGLRYLYRPVDLDRIGGPDRAPELLRTGFDLGFSAFNVTAPCKQSILPHLDEVSPLAARLGAVNTVVLRDGRTIGHNTDATGFAAGLERALPGRPRARVVQLGTGGAGSATAHALLEHGTRSLGLFDVDAARARRTAEDLAARFPGTEVLALDDAALPDAVRAADGLVNATPVGMHHHPGTPLDLDLLRPSLWVSDLVYLPQETPLIRRARELGCPVMPGGHLAAGQAVDAFRLITGREPDAAAMLADLREALAEREGAAL